jgi:hypothetical protein
MPVEVSRGVAFPVSVTISAYRSPRIAEADAAALPTVSS